MFGITVRRDMDYVDFIREVHWYPLAAYTIGPKKRMLITGPPEAHALYYAINIAEWLQWQIKVDTEKPYLVNHPSRLPIPQGKDQHERRPFWPYPLEDKATPISMTEISHTQDRALVFHDISLYTKEEIRQIALFIHANNRTALFTSPPPTPETTAKFLPLKFNAILHIDQDMAEKMEKENDVIMQYHQPDKGTTVKIYLSDYAWHGVEPYSRQQLNTIDLSERNPITIAPLTSSQIKMLPSHRDKWLAIATCTEKANRAAAEEGVIQAYTAAGLKPPRIAWCGSPLAAVIARSIKLTAYGKLRKMLADPLENDIPRSVWDSVMQAVSGMRCSRPPATASPPEKALVFTARQQVRDLAIDLPARRFLESTTGPGGHKSHYYEIRDSICNPIAQDIVDPTWNLITMSMRNTVRRYLDSTHKTAFQNFLKDNTWDPILQTADQTLHHGNWHDRWSMMANLGQHDAAELAFYEYLSEVLGYTEETRMLKGLWAIAKNAGWFIPDTDVCWMTERYNTNNFQGRIHRPDGPLIAYPDGFEIYGLNGAVLPKHIVMTPAEEIDPSLILTERNVTVRKEIIKKVGIHKVIQKIGATTLHEWNGYRLLHLEIPDMRTKAVYLHMQNPSTGETHIEGVPPEITTCQEALSWRVQGLKWNPTQLK